MDKYESAILEYEQWRQEVVKQESRRNNAVNACTKAKPFELDSKPCLAKCYDDTAEERRANGEYYSYGEIFEIGLSEGNYCESCHDAYKIKHGPLAVAKKEFGDSKRRLSALGKTLGAQTLTNR